MVVFAYTNIRRYSEKAGGNMSAHAQQELNKVNYSPIGKKRYN